MRTKEGMVIACAKGKPKGKKPKLFDRRQTELRRKHDTGDYSISDLAELFNVSRPTAYRVLQRTPSVGAPFTSPVSWMSALEKTPCGCVHIDRCQLWAAPIKRAEERTENLASDA